MEKPNLFYASDDDLMQEIVRRKIREEFRFAQAEKVGGVTMRAVYDEFPASIVDVMAGIQEDIQTAWESLVGEDEFRG